jgi:hypothetical protein
MGRSTLDIAFEELAVAFLSTHPGLRHEWRDVPGRFWRARRDLICAPGQSNEVFASLLGGQIAVGVTAGMHDDFEDYGRGLPDAAIAREAFTRFVDILREAGLVAPAADCSAAGASRASDCTAFLRRLD